MLIIDRAGGVITAWFDWNTCDWYVFDWLTTSPAGQSFRCAASLVDAVARRLIRGREWLAAPRPSFIPESR
jgi:hypothetical protein